MPCLDRLIYIDDSGRPQSGRVVYGWIEIAPDRWADVLKRWLDLRRRLWREFGIPVVRELHTVDYVNGRGRISQRFPEKHRHGGVDFWKDFGRDVAERCLETLRCAEGVRLGAVFRDGPAGDFAATREQAYSSPVERLEAESDSADSLAMVFMDGDGSDSSYRASHRRLKLDDRRVIEDAVHVDSRESHLIQMADLVAWSANAALDRHANTEFAWHWYEDYLAEHDPHRSPQGI